MNSGKLICVSSSTPSNTLTPGGAGGSMMTICPHTGSIVSSLRIAGDMAGKLQVGVSTNSSFPKSFCTDGDTLISAYGSTSKKDDTYAMLVTLRSSSLNPIIHWKSRLPEAQMTAGLLVSKCGNFVIGGGKSGSLYIWKSFGGTLLRAVKSHYREVTALEWSDSGSQLLTGGADGIVNLYSLMDLVEQDGEGQSKIIKPVRTWANHHLTVTTIKSLLGGRAASASDDSQVLILELSSGRILATIQMPSPVSFLTSKDNRLYAGSTNGIIFLIDLDEHAMHQSEQDGLKTLGRRSDQEGSTLDHVFTVPTDRPLSYITDLRGHDHCITALSVFRDRGQDWLVSGDKEGYLRVWDLLSRGCVRIVQPWRHSAGNSKTAKNSKTKAAKNPPQATHPISGIRVIESIEQTASFVRGSSMFSSERGSRNSRYSLAPLLSPLSNFPSEDSKLATPRLQSKRQNGLLRVGSFDYGRTVQKRQRKDPVPDVKAQNYQLQIDELQQQLKEAKSTIERWEAVNNKLLARLQSQNS